MAWTSWPRATRARARSSVAACPPPAHTSQGERKLVSTILKPTRWIEPSPVAVDSSMMAVAAPRAEPILLCPACTAADARPSPSAFADPLLACPACGHRWVADPTRAPDAAFYDDLHAKDLINLLPAGARRAMHDEWLRLIEE